MGLIDGADIETQFMFDPDLMPEVRSMTYSPHGGSARTIYGHVDAEQIEQGDINNAPLRVSVENHATRGILSSSMKVGLDTITVTYRNGDAAQTYVLPPPSEMNSRVLTFRLAGRGD